MKYLGNLDKVIKELKTFERVNERSPCHAEFLKLIMEKLHVKEPTAHNYIRRLVEDRAVRKFRPLEEINQKKIFYSVDDRGSGHVFNEVTLEEIEQGLYPHHYGILTLEGY